MIDDKKLIIVGLFLAMLIIFCVSSFTIIFLENELNKTKIEGAFTFNFLKYAIALEDYKQDANALQKARIEYVQNYYHLMSIYPDANINKLADDLAFCYNERDELLQKDLAKAYEKQTQCQRIEYNLEKTLYEKMREKYEPFMLKN